MQRPFERLPRAFVAALAWASLAACTSLPTREKLAGAPAPHHATEAASGLVDGRSRFRQLFCSALARRTAAGAGDDRPCSDWLWDLGDEPPATDRPLPAVDRPPQVFLVTGAFSECVGPEALPFRSAAAQLAGEGHRISTIVVAGRSGSEHNARQIAQRLESMLPGEEGPVVLIGYSKGANDILQFLVQHPATAARVRAVVSVAGAIGGSPLAEIGDAAYRWLFDWIPSGRCPPGDGGVLASLRPELRRAWLAANPLPAATRYYSIAAFTTHDRLARILRSPWKWLLERDVHADGSARGTDLAPGDEDVEAAAAAQVEHDLARFEGGQRCGIAAGEAHVRAFGQGPEFVRAVA